MNLWVKRTGLALVAAAVFLLSCEDDSYLLGFKSKPKFKGRYHEIKFEGEKSSVLLLGSVHTDQYSLSADPVPVQAYQYMLGQYLDPAFGDVRAELFAQFQPNNSPTAPPTFNTAGKTVQLDSVSVHLRFNYYKYGPPGDMDEKVSVHLLTDSLSFFQRYFNNTLIGYNPVPLKVLEFKLSQLVYDLANDAGRDSAFYLQGNLGTRFDDDEAPGWEFAKSLWLYMNNGDSSLVGDNIRNFRKQFYGLAFIPTQSNVIMGFNPLHGSSQVTVHYHTEPDKDTLTFPFYFTPYPYASSNAVNNITTSRSGALSGLSLYNTPYYPNNNPASTERYIQDGSTVITEINLEDYYSFIDSLEDIVINSAEISLAVADAPEGISPPSNLYAVLMKEVGNGKLAPLNMSVEADSLKMVEVASNVYTDIASFAISNELTSQSPLILSYNSSSKRYVGYASLFFQRLFNNKHKPELNIEHLGFYPATAPILRTITGRTGTYPIVTSGVGNEVNRAVLKTSGMKLKIYYTVPNKSNLE